jgi:HAD superfamily hydrolase (TIGR01509 family)
MMKKFPIAGAIFDMDGTLLDSMPAWATVGRDFMRAKGANPPPGIDAALLRMSLREAAEYIRSLGIDESPEEIQSGLNRFVDDFYRNAAPLKPGAADFLRALHSSGVRMCVATASDRAQAEAAFARTGVLPLFDRIFTCTELNTTKAEPLIFDAARALMGTPREETWVFEDARHAAETAKRAGYPVCAVFDLSEPDQNGLAAASDVSISSFLDALDHFKAKTK